MGINVLNVLGVAYKEDVISNLLLELINNSEIFKEKFLNLIGINFPKGYKVEAKTRIVTSDYGIPDILIKAESDSDSTLIVIENKLRADEGYEQTIRYSEQGCIDEIVDIMGFSHKPTFVGIFLTLVKEEPTGNKFINITYQDIVDKCNVQLEDSILNILYRNLIDNMEEFYSNLSVNNDDKILEILNEKIEPQKLYIKFRNIIEGIKFPNDLSVYIGKAGGKGRVSFIAQVTKPTWVGNKAKEQNDVLYCLSEDTFNIHLEGSFDIINKKISLPLHYETNPYVPKEELLKNTSEEYYKQYEEKRNKVRSIIHSRIEELNDKSIKKYNGSNQIASITLSLDENSTVEQFRTQQLHYIDIIAKIVDDALEKSKG